MLRFFDTVCEWIFIANVLVIYKKKTICLSGGGRKREEEEGQAI